MDATMATEIATMVRRVAVDVGLCETQMSILRCDVMAKAISGEVLSEAEIRIMAEKRRTKEKGK